MNVKFKYSIMNWKTHKRKESFNKVQKFKGYIKNITNYFKNCNQWFWVEFVIIFIGYISKYFIKK